VFAGMLVATILAVVLVPVLFVAVERLKGTRAKKRLEEAPATEEPAVPARAH
jgi:hypothetical protein